MNLLIKFDPNKLPLCFFSDKIKLEKWICFYRFAIPHIYTQSNPYAKSIIHWNIVKFFRTHIPLEAKGGGNRLHQTEREKKIIPVTLYCRHNTEIRGKVFKKQELGVPAGFKNGTWVSDFYCHIISVYYNASSLSVHSADWIIFAWQNQPFLFLVCSI